MPNPDTNKQNEQQLADLSELESPEDVDGIILIFELMAQQSVKSFVEEARFMIATYCDIHGYSPVELVECITFLRRIEDLNVDGREVIAN